MVLDVIDVGRNDIPTSITQHDVGWLDVHVDARHSMLILPKLGLCIQEAFDW